MSPSANGEEAEEVRHSPEVHSDRIGERLLLPKLLMHHLGLRLVRVEFELLWNGIGVLGPGDKPERRQVHPELPTATLNLN